MYSSVNKMNSISLLNAQKSQKILTQKITVLFCFVLKSLKQRAEGHWKDDTEDKRRTAL